MKRYVCTECGTEYGAPAGKFHKSFCAWCWDALLAREQFNIRMMQNTWRREKGQRP